MPLQAKLGGMQRENTVSFQMSSFLLPTLHLESLSSSYFLGKLREYIMKVFSKSIIFWTSKYLSKLNERSDLFESFKTEEDKVSSILIGITLYYWKAVIEQSSGSISFLSIISLIK